MAGRWALGQCAHCEAALDPEAPAALFCSPRCKGLAKDVRYFRRCYREGRAQDPDVRHALRTRMAFIVGGGYDAKARLLSRAIRQEVLAANDGLCCVCNAAPSAQVDHIAGSSPRRDNLQPLCEPCHRAKTQQQMVPMAPEHRQQRDAFLSIVHAERPSMAAHDELSWDRQCRALLAQTREWRELALGDLDSGYFGDGSTGTLEDYEHGVYLRMLAERDD